MTESLGKPLAGEGKKTMGGWKVLLLGSVLAFLLLYVYGLFFLLLEPPFPHLLWVFLSMVLVVFLQERLVRLERQKEVRYAGFPKALCLSFFRLFPGMMAFVGAVFLGFRGDVERYSLLFYGFFYLFFFLDAFRLPELHVENTLGSLVLSLGIFSLRIIVLAVSIFFFSLNVFE